MRYRLRTLLIVLAIGPIVFAWWWYVAWRRHKAGWRWFEFDSGESVYLPPNTPGYHWEISTPHYDGFEEVPNKTSDS
jgi:hypothetical protein